MLMTCFRFCQTKTKCLHIARKEKGLDRYQKKDLKQPISKAEHIIIVHAAKEHSFIPYVLKLHKCLDFDGDYHK